MRIAAWLLILAMVLTGVTALQMHAPPRLAAWSGNNAHPLILDRTGRPLRMSFADSWNLNQQIKLDRIPPFLTSAVLQAEDRDFYSHHGVDWRARWSGLWLNFRRGRTLRGASTISEQVVRMLHPRPRSLWSKWLEGWEAVWLETRNSKSEILEFYLK